MLPVDIWYLWSWITELGEYATLTSAWSFWSYFVNYGWMDVFPKHILEQDITGCEVVTNDKVVRAPQCLQLCKQKHMWPPEDNSALMFKTVQVNFTRCVFRGLYHVIFQKHVTISGIKKVCKAVIVRPGTFWQKLAFKTLCYFFSRYLSSLNTQKEIEQSRMFQKAFQTWMSSWMKDLISFKGQKVWIIN